MLRFGDYLLRFHLTSVWSQNNKHSRHFLWCSQFYGKDCNAITKFKIPISVSFFNYFSANGEGHEITLELDAHKEGLLRDKFVLKNEAEEEFVIVLHARVLGARKGTPMLKEGIRCIHHAKDEEGEHSDWTGFE